MSSQRTANPQPFSGTINELLRLSLPICLMTLSSSLVLFVERLFYGHLSSEVMEAAVITFFVYGVFQAPCLVIAMMAQVSVGRLEGASQREHIGSTVWQFIWFSLLSAFITTPLGMLFGVYYFEGTSIGPIAVPYLFCLLAFTFLYPLGISLSSFYIGRGKTRLCLLANVAVCCVNILIAYPFILGIEGWIPSYGLLGGALSNLVAQSGFVVALFTTFLSPKYARVYGTRRWRFQPQLFWDSIYPGLLKAAYRISTTLCFTCISHIMITKQGDYLLFWSITATITAFLPFAGEAVCQALTTVTANILGAKNYHLLDRVSTNGYLLIVGIIVLAGLPLLLFPEFTFHFIFPEIALSSASIHYLFFAIWCISCTVMLCYVPISRLLAYRDTNFFLLTGGLYWIKNYGILYLAVNIFDIDAVACLGVFSLSNAIDFGLYQWRAQSHNKQVTLPLNASLGESV